MSVGGHPGQTYDLKVTSNDGTSVVLSDGKVEMTLQGQIEFDYYPVDAEFIWHVRPKHGGKSYLSPKTSSAS